MDYSHYYGQTAAYNTQSQNYQQYWAAVQFGQFPQEYIQQKGYYSYPLANYNMQNHNYQQFSNNLQGLQLAPPHIQRGNKDDRPWKSVIKKPLDHTLILNGVIIWAYEPTTDEWGLPAKPFACCRSSGGHLCTQRELNYGGYNHPFLVLDHCQNPESREEGDMILEIVPLTSFTGKSILQTYSDFNYCKRMNSLPIEFNSHRKQDRPKEIELLNRLQKPLLGLENSSTSRQLFVEINHIYRVSVKQLHAYSPQKPDASRYVRLNKQGYNEVRSRFGLPTDGEIFDKRIETCPSTSRPTPKMSEEPFLKRAEFNLVGFNRRLLERSITLERDEASLEQPIVFNPVACKFVPSPPVYEVGRRSSLWSWV
ncbi:7542e66e-9d67-40a7-87ad-7e0e95a8bd64-CDS [Sclerotinia trifoliorum]|uniref:7542e66e-9d67-40a7-87ad-7e0e95a8bd64-CDS n=1 Tax=Sclerotinia trifoliorum TaxID=28548 RepID=A0A8H2VWJ0_9HELO|nr:7542e66e-9d67-40a7-87ad-7e0e95a8bd64-CDS [Sclerotinia trifoliorum]